MMYLIWELLNIGLLIYFLTICFKVTKLIREKKGLLVTVFFVLALVSFIVNANKDSYSKTTDSNQTKTWENAFEDSSNLYVSDIERIEMENDLVTSCYLEVSYSKDKNDNIVPKSACTSNSGFMAGTKWTPMSIELNKTNDKNKYNYSVIGVVDWNLLGIIVYSQNKTFSGNILTKKTVANINYVD